MQIKNYMKGDAPMEVFVRSFFAMGQGILLVENKAEDGTKLEFTFKFTGSENMRIKGSGPLAMEVSVKSRPGSQIAVVLEAENVWEAMPVRYSYSYRIL